MLSPDGASASKKYRVTPSAHNDLRNMGRDTEKTWGKTQRNTYLKQIEARFQSLANTRC